jgi:hypothetical protein
LKYSFQFLADIDEIGSSCWYSFLSVIPSELVRMQEELNAVSFSSHPLSECKPLFYQYSGFQEYVCDFLLRFIKHVEGGVYFSLV